MEAEAERKKKEALTRKIKAKEKKDADTALLKQHKEEKRELDKRVKLIEKADAVRKSDGFSPHKTTGNASCALEAGTHGSQSPGWLKMTTLTTSG